MKIEQFAKVCGRIAFPFIYYPLCLRNGYLFLFQCRRIHYFNQSETHYKFLERYTIEKECRLQQGIHPVIVEALLLRSLVRLKTAVEIKSGTDRCLKWCEQKIKR